MAFAESFERFPAYPVLDVNEIDKLLSTFPPTALGAIFAGNEVSTINSVLVCDDFALSNVARSLGTGAVNTQAVLQELRLSSVISDAEYSMLIEQLVLMNYRFVRMGHEDILRRIEESGYVTTLGIRKMIRTLEGPDCSVDSAVFIGARVIAALAMSNAMILVDLILPAILGSCTGSLRHGRESNLVLEKFRLSVTFHLRLHPLRRDYILRAVDLYIRLDADPSFGS